jgi:hypothetical protein
MTRVLVVLALALVPGLASAACPKAAVRKDVVKVEKVKAVKEVAVVQQFEVANLVTVERVKTVEVPVPVAVERFEKVTFFRRR